MLFTKKEKKTMEKLFANIDNDPEEIYTIEFSNGDLVEAKVDVCYETDNGLELDDENYEEYNACAVEVLKVLSDNSKSLRVGELIEINYHDYPKKIINSKKQKF